MIRRKFLVLLGLTLAFAMTLSYATTNCHECRIIRIHKELGTSGKLVRLEPETLYIAKGTCVIWINWVQAKEVRVNFREDGKKCQDATESPMGFKFAENCFVTNYLPLGGTSSLRFNDEGTFAYEVEIPGETRTAGSLGLAAGKVKAKGTITVK